MEVMSLLYSYERLRKERGHGAGGSGGPGYGLLVQRGLAGWIEIGSICAPRPTEAPGERMKATALPVAERSAVVRQMAEMACRVIAEVL